MAETAQAFQNGRYNIISQLGTGGIASVWRVFDKHLEVERAIKIMQVHNGQYGSISLPSQPSQEGNQIERFIREAKLMVQFDHPNILTVHDFFTEGGSIFIVMEKCLGSLDHWVQSNGPMPLSLAIQVLTQALQGLEYAHNLGIVHRDIKPHNLLISMGGLIKISDFGLASQAYISESLTKTNALLGSIQFMSPEQRQDSKHVDGHTDVYALAMTLVWLLEGKSIGDLYIPEVIEELREKYPAPIVDIIEQAGRRKPEERLTTQQMKEAFLALEIDIATNTRTLQSLSLQEISLSENTPLPTEATLSTPLIEPSQAATNSVAIELPKHFYWSISAVGLLVIGLVGFLAYKEWNSNPNPSLTSPSQEHSANADNSSVKIEQPAKIFPTCTKPIVQTQFFLHMGPREAYTMSMIDINQDNHLDAVYTNLMDKSFSIYLGNGQTPLDQIEPIEIPTLRAFNPPLFGDLNNDGILDLVGLHTDGSRITIHKGLGQQSYRGLEVFGRDEMLQEPPPVRGTLVDINQDGWLDLLFSSRTITGIDKIYIRYNGQRGLDYPILDLPGVEEEPLGWHKPIADIQQQIFFLANSPNLYWIQEGSLYEQSVKKGGILGEKSIIEQGLEGYRILEATWFKGEATWFVEGPLGNVLQISKGTETCQLMENIRKFQPFSARGQFSFGDWNEDGQLDYLTSVSCSYCTSNHILHIGQAQ